MSQYQAEKLAQRCARLEARVTELEAHVAGALTVFEIAFDYESFGLFATRELAETDLARQIAAGGPAWDDCQVVERKVWAAAAPQDERNPDGLHR